MGLFQNIVTFGASGRIEKKLAEFETLQMEYEQCYQRTEEKRIQANSAMEKLIHTKLSAVESLKAIQKISQNLKGKERDILHQQVGEELQLVEFDRVEETITAADTAIHLAKGASVGVGTALGAWALVSSIGTASTGTAIASLTGAAATNATLAWFGGGALAMGGGGMAAGTAVLGGIVAIPALALAGVFSHLKANKQIKEIENQMLNIARTIEQINDNLLRLEVVERRTLEVTLAIQKAEEAFLHELKVVYKQIYPYSFLSKWLKSLRKLLLRKPYFSKHDLQHIAFVGGIAHELAILIDTKIFE